MLVAYDAFDRIIEQNNSGVYTQVLYTPIGKIGVMKSLTTYQRINIPLPGGDAAVYDTTGPGFHYRHADWLGSARFASSTGQTKTYDRAFAPYGEVYANSGNTGKDIDFTGQLQDTLPGLQDFLHREYNPVQGRWIQPDPAGLAAADPSNPQSWNRYAYVLNDPLSAIDPDGLDCVYDAGNGQWYFNRGDCDNTLFGGNGYYFDGTIDPNAVSTNPNGDFVASVDSGTGFSTQCSGECPDSVVSATANGQEGDVPIYGINGQGSQIIQQVGAMTAPFTQAVNCATAGVAAQIPGGTTAIGAGENDATGQKIVGTSIAISPAKYSKSVAGAASKVGEAGFPELAEATAKAGARLAKYAPAASKALGVIGGVYMVYDAAHQTYICYKKH